MAASTASSAPAARKSARSRSLGRNATQLRPTSAATCAVDIARLPSSRTSSPLRSGSVPPRWARAAVAQRCPVNTSTRAARSAGVIRRFTSRPGAGRALEIVFHLLHVRGQAPRRRRDAGISGRRGWGREGVGQPRRVHGGETRCQVGARHLVVGEQGPAQLVRVDGAPDCGGRDDVWRGGGGGGGGPRVHQRARRTGGAGPPAPPPPRRPRPPPPSPHPPPPPPPAPPPT